MVGTMPESVDPRAGSTARLTDLVMSTLRRSGPNVVIVGDVMLDEYVGGRVDRVSPEAPVPVIDVESEYDHLGGAANVARQVVALGGIASLFGVVGPDRAGARIREHCGRVGIEDGGIVTDASRVTTTKQRITVGRQQVARLDREITEPIAASVELAIADRLRDLDEAGRPDIVILSDYAKGVLTDSLIQAVIRLATSWGVPVLVDPKHADLTRFRGAALIKANLAEFVSAVGRPAVGDLGSAIAHEGRELIARAEVDQLIVTRGAAGLVVLPRDGEPVSLPASAARRVRRQRRRGHGDCDSCAHAGGGCDPARRGVDSEHRGGAFGPTARRERGHRRRTRGRDRFARRPVVKAAGSRLAD